MKKCRTGLARLLAVCIMRTSLSFTAQSTATHRRTRPMTSLRSELPDDLKSCHALIAQLQAELRAATEQLAKLQGKADEAQDATEQVAHLEALLAKYQETIADQQQTIENLAADNALLKRSLFGCRRERFTDDPAQTLLFDPTSDSSDPDDEDEQPKQKKKRTSKGWKSACNRDPGRRVNGTHLGPFVVWAQRPQSPFPGLGVAAAADPRLGFRSILRFESDNLSSLFTFEAGVRSRGASRSGVRHDPVASFFADATPTAMTRAFSGCHAFLSSTDGSGSFRHSSRRCDNGESIGPTTPPSYALPGRPGSIR